MIRTVLRDAPAGAELGPFGDVTCQRVALRLLERDADGLLQMLQTEPREVFVEQEGFTPKALYAAWAHQLRGDRAASQAAFDASLGVANSALHAQPNNWSVHAACGLALAGLGRRDPALDEARWLEESDVYRRSTYDGANPAIARVMIVAHLADADEAVDEIERLLGQPGYLTIHALRLDPRWDPIREHPRFQALLAKDAHERSLT
jgi:serine/threonine-protein kinase